MRLDEPGLRSGTSRPAAAVLNLHEDPGARSSGELVRLFAAPAIVALLFVGGVYWIRLQLPAGSAGQQSASIVQVHLLPRRDPAVVPVAAAPQSVAASVANRADIPVNEPDPPTPDDPVATLSRRAPSPAETPAPRIGPMPSSVNMPPSSASVKFQQALLRHVARYQHYPIAAQIRRLQGTVETVFSMSRDGTLLGVWVKTSSGQAVLDKEAIETIRRAQPLPSIPSELPDRLSIQVMLAFDPA